MSDPPSRYILDTSPLTAYLLGRSLAVTLIRPWIAQGAMATSILCDGEVTEHFRGSKAAATKRSDLRQLLREVQPLSLTYNTMERYADLRRRLRPPHGPGLIGDIDTLIAATALDRNRVLVTTDSDFHRVPDLKLLVLPRMR